MVNQNWIRKRCRDLDYHTGDIIWISFEPHAGHEEDGHDAVHHNDFRPMLVLSNHYYNLHRLVIGMAITSHVTSYSSRYVIPLKTQRGRIKGFILPANLSGFDKLARHASRPVDKLASSLWPKIDLFVRSIFQKD